MSFVLCHTIFNDSYRTYPEPTEHQESAKFLLRYIIEKSSELDSGLFVAATSESVTEGILQYLPYNQGHPAYPAQMILVMKTLVLSLPTPTTDINESVIIISDMLSSRFENIILVSNMQKKIEKVLRFYQSSESTPKKWRVEDIPFRIMNTTELEMYLRSVDIETCKKVDSRIVSQISEPE